MLKFMTPYTRAQQQSISLRYVHLGRKDNLYHTVLLEGTLGSRAYLRLLGHGLCGVNKLHKLYHPGENTVTLLEQFHHKENGAHHLDISREYTESQ